MFQGIKNLAARAASYIVGHPQAVGPETAWKNGWIWYNPTSSNVDVTQSTALTCSAVYAAIRIISESVASLPLNKYRRKFMADGAYESELDTSSAMAWWFRNEPNPAMTPMTFLELMTSYAVSWGNGCAEIERNGRGDPVYLWPLRPDWLDITAGKDNVPVYKYTKPGESSRYLLANEVLHVPGPGFNGVSGYSVIALARESIGAAIAAERYGGAFFGNSARPSGILKHAGVLTPEKKAQVKSAWEAAYGGTGNANRVAVLGADYEWQAVGIPPEDAQFLESRQFSVLEISRWFNVPPHMLGDLTRATFSNIEHMGIQFVTNTLRPWLLRIEQELNRKLILSGSGYWKFNPDALMRGDTLSRYQAHEIALRNWSTVNEIRKLEDMAPVDGDLGDFHFMPANTLVLTDDGPVGAASSPANDAPQDDPPADDPEPDDPAAEPDDMPDAPARTYDPERVVREFGGLFQDVLKRSQNKEQKATETARRKHGDGVAEWARSFHHGEQAAILREWLVPVVDSMRVRMLGDTGCVVGVQPAIDKIVELHAIAALSALKAGLREYVTPTAGADYARLAVLSIEEGSRA